jgi:hypothetical protein
MSWKRDRDSLIAQTIAFVQSVAGRKEEPLRAPAKFAAPPADLALLEEPDVPPMTRPPVFEPERPAAPPPSATPIARPKAHGEMANEIRARVASFRAHQERFNREREEYFSATLARLRAAIDDAQRPGK